MLISKQILKLLTDLESDRVERTISTNNTDKFCEAVCAFANDIANHQKPGYLIIGAKDNGELNGLKLTDELLLNLSSIRSDGNVLPQPALSVHKFSFDKGDIAVVEVLPSVLTPVRYKGKIWIRIGPRKAVANESEERILIEKRISQAGTFDALPCLDATIDDIKTDLFLSFYLPKAIDADILRSENRSITQQLASLRFFDLRYNCPTYAAIVLFGKNPEYFLPGAYLQYVKFTGENVAGNIVSQYKFEGNLSEMLPKLDTFIETTVSASRPIPISVLREEIVYNYPYWAIRELLMNSIMHRDYQANAPARLYEFTRNLTISNPGNLYGNARPENFPTINDYRNPIIAEAMKVLGFVNKFSRGVFRVKEELKNNGNGEPIFDFSLLTAFSVQVSAAANFFTSKKMSSDFNKSDPQLDPQLDPQSVFTSESNEYKILKFCLKDRSAANISHFFGIKDKSYFRKKYLLPLIAQDLLEMTIPNKPNSRLQKYKTTAAGEEFVKNKI